MVLVHTAYEEVGEPCLRVEEVRVDHDAGRWLVEEELAEAVRKLWPSDEAPLVCEGVTCRPGWGRFLAFLSAVQGRKFRNGIFLAPETLALADDYRAAARVVAIGRLVPTLTRQENSFQAVWRTDVAGSPFFQRCVDALARRAGRTPLETGGRHETAEDAWLAALRADDAHITFGHTAQTPEDAARCARELDDLAGRLTDWLSPLTVPPAERLALRFRLLPPATAEGAWRLDYVPPQTRLGLIALGQAIRIFPALTAENFRKEDAEAFLRTGATALVAAGFAVETPPGILGEHVLAEADLEVNGETMPMEESRRDVRAKLVIRVAGEVVTEEEIVFLLEQKDSLVFFRDRWIEVDRAILKEALRALRDQKGRKLSVQEAVAFLSGARRLGALKIAKARAHGWLRGLVNELKAGDGFRVLPVPKGFKGELRDYQLRGFSWLEFLSRWGFGACLADDMGLGKTVETIAWVLQRGPRLGAPVLVVAPVSVTTNWTREFAKFAPSLKVYLHQGGGRAMGASFAVACRRSHVVVTGYSLLVKDFRDFRNVGFSALVLDEAQVVKNPDTRVARAACALNVPVKVALTGTPLENSVLDLWSIEEFLNPGLLGARRDFIETFGRQLARTAEATMAVAAAARLRHALAPFMLRRLKSDPGIAAELGEKREIREYCPLSVEQRRQYEDALRRFRENWDGAEGASIVRRGRMLALLTELKQVCDGDGKLARLEELLQEIFEAGESALVFTQYVTVARRIRERLADVFGRRFPFLHGGLSPARREHEIVAFNDDPAPTVFLVSLKAGGFGLNLTHATHVIHFDRWWNPAVENQATDRAHRIGQTKTVFVHLFISTGTLEERIDDLLESKRRLAGDIVGSGEAFLTKMSEREFERTVALA